MTFPKKGTRSVGVSRKYCGNLENLYLPQERTDDPVRCREAGVPEDGVFQEKWEIALPLPQEAWQKQTSDMAPKRTQRWRYSLPTTMTRSRAYGPHASK